MIDTVTYTCVLALLPPEQWLKGWRGWKSEGETEGYFGGYERTIRHHRLGVRLFVQSGTVVRVEAELPKLLYGHNGRLIKTQAELDLAILRLKRVLQSVCVPFAPTRGFHPGDFPGDTATHYKRIDLVWQFNLNPTFVFLALRNAKHPAINKAKGEWRDQTLTFPGTKLFLRLYDKKAKEHARCEHPVFRIEAELKGEKIDEHFHVGENEVLGHLSIDAAYAAYREVFLGFGSDLVPEPGVKGDIHDFLAHMVTKLPEEDPVGLYCLIKGMCPRRSRDFRKEVGRRVPRLVHFSWVDLLPPGRLPPVVEIVDERAEHEVARLFEQLGVAGSFPRSPSFSAQPAVAPYNANPTPTNHPCHTHAPLP